MYVLFKKNPKKVCVPFCSRAPASQLRATSGTERNGTEEICWAVVDLNELYISYVYMPSGREIGAPEVS
jgi:hypothetical protein